MTPFTICPPNKMADYSIEKKWISRKYKDET